MATFRTFLRARRKANAAAVAVAYEWAGSNLEHGFTHVGFQGWMGLAGIVIGTLSVNYIPNDSKPADVVVEVTADPVTPPPLTPQPTPPAGCHRPLPDLDTPVEVPPAAPATEPILPLAG